ncbi:hypothetical protein [Parerythrobacter jejuensis]|uniref:Uncharacterized protein n=1 Tax=Parerythrobacter jejuensis TaxID=795812 RepID=A0A845AK54_9SPHN|nr:hypothetical protein [Parerythrobacter jejuensis]MXP31122.1 hypothetical protein [Parerythrobacter jejuensis]MXP33882.1 hypothetical protein [Parerythrobacter jejuensis]
MVQTDKRKAGGKPPISAHPVFPVIVALWFAALFGIGSMVLPTILIEKIVVALGLPAIISSAAPPIGFTARLLIALVAAVIGGAGGMFIARKIVTSQADETPRKRTPSRNAADKHPDAPAKKPIFATRELGEEGLGPVEDEWDAGSDTIDDASSEQGNIPGRRRALSVTEEAGRSEYLEAVPVPGEEFVAEAQDEPLDLLAEEARDDADHEIEPVVADDSSAEPAGIDLSALTVGTDSPSEDGESRAPQPSIDFHKEAEMDAPRQVFGRAQPFMSASDDAGIEATPTTEDVPMNEAKGESPEDTGAMAYNPFADRAENPDAVEADQIEPEAVEATYEAAPVAAAPVESAPAQPAAAPLAGLTMSELVERFARSMQIKSEARAAEQATPLVFKRNTEEAPAAAKVDAEAEEGFAAQDAVEDTPVVAEPLDNMPAGPSFVEAAAVQESPAAPEAAPTFAAYAPDSSQDQPEAELVPSALRPLDLAGMEDDEPEDSIDELELGAGDLGRLFKQQSGETAPFAPPEQPVAETGSAEQPRQVFTPDAVEIHEPEGEDESEQEDDFSSLLEMKHALSANRQETVRIEDDTPEAGGQGPEAVVVFPGQDAPAIPAASPVASDPFAPPAEGRLFDAPADAQDRKAGFAAAPSTAPGQVASDPAETEQALRDALEKLQRMSGAA